MKKTLYLIIGIAILLLFNFSQGNSELFILDESNYQIKNDTTVYEVPFLDIPAELPDAIDYFLKNNQFKDWKDTDEKKVALQGIVEKDGTITGVSIRKSSEIDVLDKEAVRLIKTAKYIPGKYKGQNVRSKFTVVVYFPAKEK